jgi:hypothetical protein
MQAFAALLKAAVAKTTKRGKSENIVLPGAGK